MVGKLIVIEGLDRAGKSTQCVMLAKHLRSQGHNVEELKFPDRTTTIGQMINTYLTTGESTLSDEAIHLLFSANRWELNEKIRSLLQDNINLVVDRYTFSGVAFSAAKGLDLEWCTNPDIGLPQPDLVIFLDVDELTAAKRGGYGEERYETKEMQTKVRNIFRQLRKTEWEWILADGTIDEVGDQIRRSVAKLFS